MIDHLHYKLGKLFPPSARIAGLIFILIGLYLIGNSFVEDTTSSIYGGFLPLIIGLFMLTSINGILINVHEKTYKNYTSILGYKQGSWKTIKPYPYITILRQQVSTYAHSRSNRTTQTSSHLYYDIYLIDETKRNRVHIKRMKDETEARNSLKELSDLLDVKIFSSSSRSSTV